MGISGNEENEQTSTTGQKMNKLIKYHYMLY